MYNYKNCVWFSVEMMGHLELRSECDINQLEPLLPQDVVDDLLSKYVKTFTVNNTHRQTHTGTQMDVLFNLFRLQSLYTLCLSLFNLDH